MIRTLLATTALATLLSAGAIAQDAAAPADPNAPAATDQAPAADAAPATDAAPAAPADTNAAATTDTTAANADASVNSILATGYTTTDEDNLATKIIGEQVYSSTDPDAEHIGDVNDLVVDQNGDIAAVIIGVGGFLGIGEKNVAVNYSELQWSTDDNGDRRFVLATTKDALEAAPDFKAVDDDDAAANANGNNNAAPADNNAMAPADNNAMAPADNNANAPADNNAMAPADNNAAPADNNNMAATNDANANNNAAPAAAIDPSGFTDVQLTADELEGTTAYGPNNENLGKISDVVLGEDGKTVEAVVVDFGGFLGIGTKPVAVAAQNLKFQQDQNNNRYVMLNVTREQLDQAAAFDANTFKDNRDQQLLNPQG